MEIHDLAPKILTAVRTGMAIPAQPLALDENRKFSPLHQRALCRYYIDAGAGGIAVGVHSTQFEIRNPDIGLFRPVLAQTAEFIDEWSCRTKRTIFKVAGVCGKTPQAVQEAKFVREHGYHACLLSLSAFSQSTEMEMLRHCREISRIMPVIGFYLQPKVGGRILPYSFWRQFMEIENVLAVKIAPFNRYQTMDVVRALADSGRDGEITLYTGNDDNIIIDLLTEYRIRTSAGIKKIRINGGLLGHWSVWTSRAVALLDKIHKVITSGDCPAMADMLAANTEVTDCNAAFFDAAHNFAGCIPGIHEVLRRQGLLPGIWCLNPEEKLSPGQKEEIDRVYQAYPHLNDDLFVKTGLEKWFS